MWSGYFEIDQLESRVYCLLLQLSYGIDMVLDCHVFLHKLHLSRKESLVFFLLGDSPVSEFYMPTFRNTLFHLHRQC
jgi:hypothetical protein